MKKAFVVLAVVISLTLSVTAVYAQLGMKWDVNMTSQALAKGKKFKVDKVEVVSVDPKAMTAVVKGPKGNTALGRFDYAETGGEFLGVKDLKPGDMIKVEGVQAGGYNYVTKCEKVSGP
jgi:hypothetical protein